MNGLEIVVGMIVIMTALAMAGFIVMNLGCAMWSEHFCVAFQEWITGTQMILQ